MQVNKYVLALLWFVFIFVLMIVLNALFSQNKGKHREPFVSKIREGYRASRRGMRNIVRDIYKYGYLYTSKMLRT